MGEPAQIGALDDTQDTWPPGTEVVSLFTFKASSDDDLGFKRNDVLTIVKSTRDPNWYQAKNQAGKVGMIPRNYVQKRGEVHLQSMPWYHGLITRTQAEELLIKGETGLFLVRESTNYRGDYTLCVVADGKVEHYHVLRKNEKLTIDEDDFFDNLIEMVKHYEKDANGLCTQLKKPVAKQGNLDFCVDKQQFIKQGWVIKQKEIKLLEKLGDGDFGDVHKGEYKGLHVAVKSLKDSSTAQQFLAEASVMTTLRHENLVQLIGVVLGDKTLIVTEFMAKGSLVDYLRSRGRNVVTKKDQIHYASDTCCGMQYLEEKKLVHRDLAARNVLISEDGNAKVADFGLARSVDANHAGGRFPIKWTAPEALRESRFTNKSDMWSFGILLWEIYSFGRVPYPRIPLSDVVMHVERGYRMEAPDGCPKEIYDIMLRAWELDLPKRPMFSDIMKTLDKLREETA